MIGELNKKIEIKCSKCNQAYRLNEKWIGKKLSCRQCNHKIIVGENYKDLIKLYFENRKELQDYKSKVDSIDQQSLHHSIVGLEAFTLRVDIHSKIIYCSSSFCTYLKTSKKVLIGQDISYLSKLLNKDFYRAISIPLKDHQTKTSKAIDENGKAFEIKVNPKDQYFDIVLQDVSGEHQMMQYVNRYISKDLVHLTEEELTTFKYPERRLMSVSFTDLCGFTKFSENMPPEEVRTSVNAFFEEIIYAIDQNDGTVDKIIGDEVMALYGAPVYYKDHAFRAVLTACDQMTNLKGLRKVFSRMDKHIPGCSIAINTGEMIVGNIGSSSYQDYTVIGHSVNLAAKLCKIAKEDEIIITEPSLHSLLNELPPNWDSIENIEEPRQEFKDSIHQLGSAYEFSNDFKNKVIRIGPQIKDNPENAQFSFHYVLEYHFDWNDERIPLIYVKDLRKGKSRVELNRETVQSSKNERLFGKYKLIEILGKGGMGEVWKARDGFGNIVAIKTMISGEFASENQLKRFEREANVMSKLNHKGICKIHEVGRVDKMTYISMEYIKGYSLYEILCSQDESTSDLSYHDKCTDLQKKFYQILSSVKEHKKHVSTTQALDHHKTTSVLLSKTKANTKTEVIKDQLKEEDSLILPKKVTLSIIQKICVAIDFAHRNGVTHRDIKPANIMIRPDGEPVLMDFGLAKSNEDDQLDLSLSGQIIGTLSYMAPEQTISLKNTTEKADVYSVGAILYQMLTGKNHFSTSGDIISDLRKLEHYEPTSLKTYNPKIDIDLEVIVQKALRPDPKDRYPTIDHFLRDLRNYELGVPISARKVGHFEQLYKWSLRNKPISITVMIFFILTTLLVSGFMHRLIQEKNIADQAKEIALIAEQDALQEKSIADQAKEIALVAEQNAIVALGHLKDLSKKASPKFYLEARSFVRKYDFDQALEAIDISVQLDEHNAKAHFLKLKLLLATQQYSLFDEHFKTYNSQLQQQSLYTKLQTFQNVKDSLSLEQIHHLRSILSETGEYELYSLIQSNDQDLVKTWEERVRSTWKDAIFRAPTKGDVELNLTGRKKNTDHLRPIVGIPINRLFVGGTNIKNLNELRSMPIDYLVLNNTEVSSLEPLKNSPLEVLNVVNTHVLDLSPIQGKKIHELHLDYTDISDISFLKGMPLEFFTADDTKIKDISPLKGAPLKTLRMDRCQIEDISALKGAPLNRLSIRNSRIKDISALQGMPLKNLALSGMLIEDITPIQGLPITELFLSKNKIRDITALKGIKLQIADLGYNPIEDISSLEGMPLKTLDLFGAKIKTISYLKGMPLTHLDCGLTHISDLSSLEDMKLNYLDISGTKVLDISVLKGMPLKVLKMDNTKISNIQSINPKHLRELRIDKTDITDISILRDSKLQVLILSPQKLQGDWISVLKSLKYLRVLATNNHELWKDKQTPEMFFKKYGKY